MDRGTTVTVAFEPDPRVFCAFSLLNACGYNAESTWQFGEARVAVRRHLADRSASWRSALSEKGLLAPMLRANGALVMDVLPFLTRDFSDAVPRDEMPTTSWQRASMSTLAGLGRVLRDFAQQEGVDDLWAVHRAACDRVGDVVSPALPTLRSLIARLAETELTVTVVPNLLDMTGRGYSVSSRSHTWLYLGPPQDRPRAERLLVHELLHRWVDVLAEQVTGRDNNRLDPMSRARAMFRLVADDYPDLGIWLAEIVVRAGALLLSGFVPESGLHDVGSVLRHYEHIGLIGVTQAYRHLEERALDAPFVRLLGEATAIVHDRIVRLADHEGELL